jgi:DNA-binding HxlR family transcriptional regulator
MEIDTTHCISDRCPVEVTLAAIGGKWKALILYHITSGPRRFNELRRMMPSVTQRMLTQHLRELEGDGIVHREIRAQVPPHVEYSLTDMGKSLVPILNAMAQWGEKNSNVLRA